MSKLEEVTAAFAEECRFAKIVQTPRGDAILIGGHVIELSTPPTFPGDVQPMYVQAIVTALRRTAMPVSATASGSYGIVGDTSAGTAAV